jgi:hypothetical protein
MADLRINELSPGNPYEVYRGGGILGVGRLRCVGKFLRYHDADPKFWRFGVAVQFEWWFSDGTLDTVLLDDSLDTLWWIFRPAEDWPLYTDLAITKEGALTLREGNLC